MEELKNCTIKEILGEDILFSDIDNIEREYKLAVEDMNISRMTHLKNLLCEKYEILGNVIAYYLKKELEQDYNNIILNCNAFKEFVKEKMNGDK